jgi:dUTP pyrophosphatase
MTSQDYTFLKIFIDDNELKSIYKSAVDKHNTAVKSSIYPDAGFDLYVPKEYIVKPGEVGKVDFKIVAAASSSLGRPMSFFTYPRSSIYKTPLRLANSTGIIDSGYRGTLRGMFDNRSNETYVLEKDTRFLQICSPTLSPIIVSIVDDITHLGITERGDGGFGSTGV